MTDDESFLYKFAEIVFVLFRTRVKKKVPHRDPNLRLSNFTLQYLTSELQKKTVLKWTFTSFMCDERLRISNVESVVTVK